MRKTIIAILAAAISVTGCVYPFDPEIKSDGKPLVVIEGDILIGKISTINVSYLKYFGQEEPEQMSEPKVYIESENGKKYKATRNSSIDRSYFADLRDADPDGRYRLCVDMASNDGRQYRSEWVTPTTPPEIDEVKHHKEGDRVIFDLSLHSTTGEHYFIWSYDETWEFASPYSANCFYVPVSKGSPEYELYPNGYIDHYKVGEGCTFCWRNSSSTGIHFTSTKDLSDDVVTEKEFYSIPETSEKFSIAYSINVRVKSITKNCYDYWQTLSNNSDSVGDLFSPTPSDIRGNIICVTDSTETVFGYIAATVEASHRVTFTRDEYNYYKQTPQTYPEMFPAPEDSWPTLYKQGYRPVFRADGLYLWGEGRCVDCRMNGGSKNKPDYWPTNHY